MVTTTPDSELPIFPFRPNWKTGVVQGLSFLTDVLASKTGAEQRRPLRLSPRRSMTYDVLLEGRERAFFENLIHMLGSSEFMVPLWWEAGAATTAIVAGAASIQFDQTYREFTDGEMGIILEDGFTWEVFTVATVGASQLLLTTGVSRTWSADAKVYPLRRARLVESSEVRAHTDAVGTASVALELVQANPFPTEFAFPANPHQYRGHPVMTREPNWKEPIATTYARLLDQLDNDTGLPHWFDEAARGFTAQAYAYQMHGQAEHMAFRDLLLDLQGRLKPIWVPTYTSDFQIAADVVAGSDTLEVLDAGYSYCGGPRQGREDLQILLADGTRLFRRITGATAGAPGRELLVVGEAFPDGLAASAVKKISFMDVCRLDADDIEIKHHADTDGAATSTLVFKAFADTRQELSTDPGFSIVVGAPGEPGPSGYIYAKLGWSDLNRNMNLHIRYPDGEVLNYETPYYAGGRMLRVGGQGPWYRNDPDFPPEDNPIQIGWGGEEDVTYEESEVNAQMRGAYTILVEYYLAPETVGSPEWPSKAFFAVDVTAPDGSYSIDGVIDAPGQGVLYPVLTVYID